MKSIILAAALAAFPLVASAQPRCYPEPSVMMQLEMRYGETLQDEREAPAPDGSGLMIHWQVWASEHSGTWTFLGAANGVACVFGAGGDYDGETVDDFLPDLHGTAL